MSCNKDLFFNHLNYYLLRQLDLIKQFSVEKSTSDFFNKAKIVLQNSEKVNFYSNNIFNRIKILLSDDKSIKLVPSLVEPWPQVDDSGLIFTDLSPVEFQLAPYIHDFCYMIFKYDYYGSRNTDHKFILTIILDALEKVINKKENEIFNMHLRNLAKTLSKILRPSDFIDEYIKMIAFHSYVKLNSKGNFVAPYSKNLFEKAIGQHIKVFEKIKCSYH